MAVRKPMIYGNPVNNTVCPRFDIEENSKNIEKTRISKVVVDENNDKAKVSRFDFDESGTQISASRLDLDRNSEKIIVSRLDFDEDSRKQFATNYLFIMKAEFQDFCSATSLHGWNRISGSGSVCRQLFWGLMMFLSLICAGVFAYENIKIFLYSTVTVRVDTTTAPLSDSTFPKIVICNTYKIRNSFMDVAFDPKELGSSESIKLRSTFKKEFLTGYSETEMSSLDILGLYKKIQSPSFQKMLNRECPYKGKFLGRNNTCDIDVHNMTDFTGLLSTSRQSIHSMVLKLQIQGTEYLDPLATEHAGADGTEDNICYAITPNQTIYKIESGTRNGIEILLDAEIFDNGDSDSPYNGFNILVTERGTFSLMAVNGFSVPVGRSIKINIKPEIYKTTDRVRKRFSYEERKCIYEGEFNLKYNIPYTLSSCIALAALDDMFDQCGNNVSHSLIYNKGVELHCYHKHMRRAGRIKMVQTANEQLVDCQRPCDRQENVVTISEHSFPNSIFTETGDFWILLRKLYWSCIDRLGHHGFKRPRIMARYPFICPVYDKYFYKNPNIVNIFENLSPSEFSEWKENNLTYDLLENLTGISDMESLKFQNEILRYGEENLVHVVAYIGEPFMTVFLTDEAMSPITFVANMGGLLGLCMGFSLVSIMEIIYQLVIGPVITWAEKKLNLKSSTEDKPSLLRDHINSSLRSQNTNLVIM